MEAVIVSWAKDHIFAEMTQYAIDTALMSGVNRVVVIEQNKSIFYNNADIVYYEGDFNYNKALNIGISHCKEEYIALCNNDVIFYDGFYRAENIMREMGIHSASPCRNNEDIGVKTRMGYKVKREMRGWCIIIDRFVLEQIGSLDETYSFHGSENVYADQLKDKNIEHHLLNGIYLDHLKSKTIDTILGEERKRFTTDNKVKYRNSKSKNVVKKEVRKHGRSIHLPSRKKR